MVEENVVCIIDLAAREVLKHYIHSPEFGDEEFCTLAWTQFKNHNDDVVLAVAGTYHAYLNYSTILNNIFPPKKGTQGDIKLIDVDSGELYEVLEGHDYSITSLCFSPVNPRWLLSGGEGPDILLWEIPAPGEDFQPR